MATGRINQKRRTRAAILAAAVELLEQGQRPTVAELADAALVSRPTAYRYFPTQEYLLFEAALESTRFDIDRELDENTLPEDPEGRLEILIDALQKRIIDKEAAFRTMLKLSLEQSPREEQCGSQSPPSRLRGGGRVRWIEEALAPVEGRLEEPDFRRLVAALSLCMGIEAQIGRSPTFRTCTSGKLLRSRALLAQLRARGLLESSYPFALGVVRWGMR